MINILFEGEKDLLDITEKYYIEGGEVGKEPPNVRNALKKLEEFGRRRTQMVIESGGWM